MKKSNKMILGILAGVIVFLLAFMLGTWGSMSWRKAAQYPPPIERPNVRASMALQGRTSDFMGLIFAATSSTPEIEMDWANVVVADHIYPYGKNDETPVSGPSLNALEPVNGFLEFMHTFFEAGYDLSDLVIDFPKCVLKNSSEPDYWIFKDSVETRIYQCEQPLQISIKEFPILQIPITEFTCILDYSGSTNIADVRVSGMTNIVNTVPIKDLNETMKPFADAIFSDIGEFKMRLVIEKMILLDYSDPKTKSEVAYWGDIHEARLEIIP